MKVCIIILPLMSLLLSTELNAHQLSSKISGLLKLIPKNKKTFHQVLNSTLEERNHLVSQLRETSHRDSYTVLRLAKLGIEKTASDQLVMSIKNQKSGQLERPWLDQIIKSLKTLEEDNARCSGCAGLCPKGIPCNAATASKKIRTVMEIIPKEEIEIHRDLSGLLIQYKSKIKEATHGVDFDDEEAREFAEIGIEKELTDQLKSDMSRLIEQEQSKKPWMESLWKDLDNLAFEEIKN